MRTKTLGALAGIAISILMPTAPTAASPTMEVPHEEPKPKVQLLNEAGERWLGRMIQCESTGSPIAVNPKDLDGTPSYGLLQFKPSTFAMYAARYDIEGELMDPEAQKAIVRRMASDPRVRWEREFPDCVARLGRPPMQ